MRAVGLGLCGAPRVNGFYCAQHREVQPLWVPPPREVLIQIYR